MLHQRERLVAAEVAGEHAHRGADQSRDDRHREADQQRDARAVQHPGQDVAAEMVGAHPVLQAGGQHARPEIALERVKRGDDTGPIPQRMGALRHQVPQWLRMPPLSHAVLQVTEAHLKHGGAGAYYVYLRRR